MSSPSKTIQYSFCTKNNGTHQGATVEGVLYLFGHDDDDEAAAAPHLVLLCAGYPDDETVFFPFAARIATDADHLVGVMALPGFGSREGSSDGYSFVEWRSAVRAAVRALCDHSTHPEPSLTGIFHDWGCLAGLMYTNHALGIGGDKDDKTITEASMRSTRVHDDVVKTRVPDQLVLFDVLLGPHRDDDKKNIGRTLNNEASPSWSQKLWTLVGVTTYQLVMAQTWLLHRYVHRVVAFLYSGLCTTLVLMPLRLVPLTLADYLHVWCPGTLGKALELPRYAFPYYHAWKAVLRGRVSQTFPGAHLPASGSIPILYLYGDSKPFPLHAPRGLDTLLEEDCRHARSRVVRVEKAGHWLYLQRPDVCWAHVKHFLGELTGRSGN